MIYRFADFSLDTDQRELRHNGAIVPLEPQVFDLLAYLIHHRERIIARDELFSAIWTDRIVSDAVLSTRIHAARAAIGDNGSDQRLIRTLRTRGVRFVGEAREEGRPQAKAPPSAAPQGQSAGTLAERPGLAVLPFADFGGDARQRALADAMSEELIVALSKSGWLSVVSRGSAFAFRGQAMPAGQVARRLGVRYILEGGVREAGDRVRVTARLIDAAADHQLWAERYERDVADLFAVQDEIVDKLVEAIGPQLYFAEHMRAQRKTPDSLNAWECIVRALSLMNSRKKADVATAHGLLQQAIARDPKSAQAHSLLSIVTTLRVHMGWSERHEAVPAALAVARKALLLNADEPWAHAARGYATIWSQPEESILPLERAIALNPDFAIGHYFLALGSTYAGHLDQVFAHADMAERLGRRDLLSRGYAGAPSNVRATASFAAARYGDGVEYARAAIRDLPRSPTGYRALVMNLALRGDADAARRGLQTLRALAPDMSQQWIRQNAVWSRTDTMKRYIEAFRMAGLG